MWLETQELHSGVWSGKWDGKMEWEWDATSSCRLELQRAKLWGKKKNLKSVSCVFRCWKASKHFFFFKSVLILSPGNLETTLLMKDGGIREGGYFFSFSWKWNTSW